MKTAHTLLLVAGLTLSQHASANDLLSSAKGLLNKTEQVSSGINVSDMISSVSKSVGISQSQATGGLGAIFDYAKNNISKEQLSTITQSLPQIDSLLQAVPAISGSEQGSKDSLGGLLNQAKKYSSSLNSMANLQKQFESLGLDPEMIGKVIQGAYQYLESEQGQQVKALLEQGLRSLKL
jgi:hypothetical protein